MPSHHLTRGHHPATYQKLIILWPFSVILRKTTEGGKTKTTIRKNRAIVRPQNLVQNNGASGMACLYKMCLYLQKCLKLAIHYFVVFPSTNWRNEKNLTISPSTHTHLMWMRESSPLGLCILTRKTVRSFTAAQGDQ